MSPEGQQLLQLIEAVGPEPTSGNTFEMQQYWAALDEIDARVWCFVTGNRYISHDKRGVRHFDNERQQELTFTTWPIQYTRSRDALKRARPDGWRLRLTQETQVGDSWMCVIYNNSGVSFPVALWTEELSELHGLIRATERTHQERLESELQNLLDASNEALSEMPWRS